jgi:hypothetical protein
MGWTCTQLRQENNKRAQDFLETVGYLKIKMDLQKTDFDCVDWTEVAPHEDH